MAENSNSNNISNISIIALTNPRLKISKLNLSSIMIKSKPESKAGHCRKSLMADICVRTKTEPVLK